MTRRTLAGRFILTTEQHPHGTHLKIRSTKSSQMLVVVAEEIEPLAQAMLNIARRPRYKVVSEITVTVGGGKYRTWSVAQEGNEADTYQSFTTWKEALDYANKKVRGN